MERLSSNPEQGVAISGDDFSPLARLLTDIELAPEEAMYNKGNYPAFATQLGTSLLAQWLEAGVDSDEPYVGSFSGSVIYENDIHKIELCFAGLFKDSHGVPNVLLTTRPGYDAPAILEVGPDEIVFFLIHRLDPTATSTYAVPFAAIVNDEACLNRGLYSADVANTVLSHAYLRSLL